MLDDLEWDPEYVPGVKLGLHIFQIIFGFVCWCLSIAVFRAEGAAVVGNNGWSFAVCFLSIPAWIFLTMTPRWGRTRKYAEPHAMLVVDGVMAIFWLSAFASQAAYNTANLCGTACGLSKAIVGLGVFVTLLFAGSTFLSAYTLKYYQFHGSLPGYDKQKIKSDNIDPDKAAFSMAPHDEEAYAPVQLDDHPEHHDESPYGGGGSGPYNAGRFGPEDDDPNRYGSLPSRQNAIFDSETEYHSQQAAAGGRPYAPPTAHDDYDDDRPVTFPTADYDRTLR